MDITVKMILITKPTIAAIPQALAFFTFLSLSVIYNTNPNNGIINEAITKNTFASP